jgi:hypothetical protein
MSSFRSNPFQLRNVRSGGFDTWGHLKSGFSARLPAKPEEIAPPNFGGEQPASRDGRMDALGN